MTRSAQCLTLGVVTLLEPIDRQNAPRPTLVELLYPIDIRCVARKQVDQMLHVRDIGDHLRHATDPARHMRGKIVVEEELQALKVCSKRTAASTARDGMSKIRPTALLSRFSARKAA